MPILPSSELEELFQRRAKATERVLGWDEIIRVGKFKRETPIENSTIIISIKKYGKRCTMLKNI